MVPAALSISHPPEHQPATSTKIHPQPSPVLVTTTMLTTQTHGNPPATVTSTLAAQPPLPSIQQASSKPSESVIAQEPDAPQPARQIRQKKVCGISTGSLFYSVTHDYFTIRQDESTVCLFSNLFVSANVLSFFSSSNLVVPEPMIDIPETATSTSLPQTSDAPPAKKGKPLVPSDTLTSVRYVTQFAGLLHF